jgi:hypothetical protein
MPRTLRLTTRKVVVNTILKEWVLRFANPREPPTNGGFELLLVGLKPLHGVSSILGYGQIRITDLKNIA